MNTAIYYFSGTGNSLYLAQKIAACFENCELLPIAKTLREGKPVKADRIGLVFPVYMYGIPMIVAEFVKKIEGASYVFGVADNGGDVGRALSQLKRLLRRQSIRLNAGFSVTMPDNYTPLYMPPPPELQKEMFEDADKKIALISEIVLKNASHMDTQAPRWKAYFWPGFLYWLGYCFIYAQDYLFSVDDTCDKCWVCVSVCPVNNITLKNGKPRWNHHCQMCYACLQWCPKAAIQQFGPATRGRKRYNNPHVGLKDIQGQKSLILR